jgi:hypothetical protein
MKLEKEVPRGQQNRRDPELGIGCHIRELEVNSSET